MPVPPQIICEVAFTPGPASNPSGSFLLDDPTFGLLDTGTLGSGDTWTDISQYVRSGTISRPASRVQGPLLTYQAATATAVLKNGDGRFDPENLAGPYVSAGATQVLPMIPIRYRMITGGVEYLLFSGFADSWQVPDTNLGPNYEEITLTASDAFKILSQITLPTVAGVGAGETSGARVSRILNAAGWYTDAPKRDIATGDNTVQAATFGADALSLMQVTADSEIGELYVDGSGAVVFRNRQAILEDTRSNTVQAVFGDSGGTTHSGLPELPYTAVGRADDDLQLCNDVQATIAGSANLQEVTDATSIAKYVFPRTYERSDLILQADTDALNWAQYILYLSAQSETRFDTLTVNPLRDPDDLWPQVLGRDIGDRIQVWRRPPNLASPITHDCFIRGVEHTFDAPSASWQTVWTMQAADRYSFLTLDNATLGQLGSNALAF